MSQINDAALNISQQLFVVFFAIFWGTAANAWPKWKPFHWPFLDSGRVLARLLWSLTALNVAPVVFFGLALHSLGRASQPALSWYVLLAGVAPAFAIFGIYRIWIAGVEFKPSCFYYKADEQAGDHAVLKDVDPTQEDLKLWRRTRWGANLVAGAAYVIAAAVAAACLP